MPRILTTLFLVLLAPFLVAFLFANRQEVRISFDPTSATDPALALVLPLWGGLFATMCLGFLLGAMGMWISMSRVRRKERRHRRRIAELEREVKTAGERPERTGSTLPALPR
jgi:hypothetical protein